MPLRVWYLLGGRLPLRHREWVFRQATKPTWLAWFTVRMFLQVLPLTVVIDAGAGAGPGLAVAAGDRVRVVGAGGGRVLRGVVRDREHGPPDDEVRLPGGCGGGGAQGADGGGTRSVTSGCGVRRKTGPEFAARCPSVWWRAVADGGGGGVRARRCGRAVDTGGGRACAPGVAAAHDAWHVGGQAPEPVAGGLVDARLPGGGARSNWTPTPAASPCHARCTRWNRSRRCWRTCAWVRRSPVTWCTSGTTARR